MDPQIRKELFQLPKPTHYAPTRGLVRHDKLARNQDYVLRLVHQVLDAVDVSYPGGRCHTQNAQEDT